MLVYDAKYLVLLKCGIRVSKLPVNDATRHASEGVGNVKAKNSMGCILSDVVLYLVYNPLMAILDSNGILHM